MKKILAYIVIIASLILGISMSSNAPKINISSVHQKKSFSSTQKMALNSLFQPTAQKRKK